MGFEFTFWKLKRFCTGDGAMVTDAHVRYNDLCECIWVVCIIWSVSVADVGVILVCDSVSRVRHSSVIVESQKECGFSKSILQYRNKKCRHQVLQHGDSLSSVQSHRTTHNKLKCFYAKSIQKRRGVCIRF